MSQVELYDDLMKRCSTFAGMAFRQTFGMATIYTDQLRLNPEKSETYLSLLDGIYPYGACLAGDLQLLIEIVTHDVAKENRSKSILDLGGILYSITKSHNSKCITRNLEISMDYHGEIGELIPASGYYFEQLMKKVIGISIVFAKDATNISVGSNYGAATEDAMLNFVIGFVLDEKHEEVINNIAKVDQCPIRLWQGLIQIPLSGLEIEIIRLIVLRMDGELDLIIDGEQTALEINIPEKEFKKSDSA